MDKEMEKLLIAERAAEWLDNLEHASAEERAKFVKWLKASPQHGWEILLATSSDTVLRRLMKDAGIDVSDVGRQPSNVRPIANRLPVLVRAPRRRLAERSAILVGKLKGVRKAAAVIAFIALVSLMAVAIQAVSDRTLSTAAGEWRNVRLEDGTLLRAGPRTKVRVDFTVHQRRLYLDHGEVMAYVAKNRARPFYIETEIATARAVGTAFAVRRVEPGRASITVEEGTVAVARAPASHPRGSRAATGDMVTVKAGEGVSVTPDRQPLLSHPVDLKRELAWVQEKVVLTASSTVADAIRELNQRNRTQIRFLDRRVGERPLRGVFEASDPVSFAKMMETQLHLAVVEDHGALLLVPHPNSDESESNESVER